MARKSRKVDYVNVGNKENLVTEAENQCEKVSHAALYARLSYESEKNRERNTIETQMVLLHNFVKEQKDIVVAKEYYDISKTGTNFERDGFNEMMQEIKEGNIDCVIVKDLSRLGRNYVEAGSYIERVFPFFNVRFISVNDHYDSFRDDISLLISMSNVYNEFYSRDLAKKIRSSYRTSWANGEFPSGQMAYGYEKDKDNPHQLIPDPVAAPVVKKIFQYFIDGMTYAEIAQLDAGSSFNKKFRGEKIPTLDEVLKFCRGKLDLNIEIKYNGQNKGIVKKVVRIIEQNHFEDHCVVTSMNYSFLKQVKKANPDIRTGYIMTMTYGTISRIEAADFFSVKYTYVDEAFVREAHSLGKEVHAWTVNYRGDIKRMLDVGVDNIITDNPVLVRKVKNQESDMQTDFWDLMRYAFKM